MKRNTDKAYRTLLVYQQLQGGADTHETDIVDLVTDLLHLADEYGVDPHSVLRMAEGHYTEERTK